MDNIKLTVYTSKKIFLALNEENHAGRIRKNQGSDTPANAGTKKRSRSAEGNIKVQHSVKGENPGVNVS